MRRPRAVQPTPLDGVDVLLADLDGVVYQGRAAIPHAVDAINRAGERVPIGYITNNASRTDAAVAEQLRGFGLHVDPEHVVTSPQAAVELLANLVPAGATVLVVGGEGLTAELEKAGFGITRSADDRPAAVVQGFHPSVGWEQLAQAAFALARPRGADAGDGIPWVATNTDWTIPVDGGIAPGNGTLVSAVHTAVGRLPVVAGKPERAIFDTALARFGASSPLMIGDRLDTDILGANRAGIRSLLVLTGIDGPKQVLAAEGDSRPTMIVDDLRALHEPYAGPETAERRGVRVITAGAAEVHVDGNRVTLRRAGDSPAETLRAATAAVWGAGVPIYGLEVDPRLYSTP